MTKNIKEAMMDYILDRRHSVELRRLALRVLSEDFRLTEVAKRFLADPEKLLEETKNGRRTTS